MNKKYCYWKQEKFYKELRYDLCLKKLDGGYIASIRANVFDEHKPYVVIYNQDRKDMTFSYGKEKGVSCEEFFVQEKINIERLAVKHGYVVLTEEQALLV